MDIVIRKEEVKDYKVVECVTEEAFKDEEFSDHKEHLLVNRLRKSVDFIPELSLVAEVGREIVGHVLLTKATIQNEKDSFETLALAPVSVLPEYQGKGIGSKLIDKSLEEGRKLGFKSVIVLGHEKYYPKFGFKKAISWNIKAPFEVPEEVFMALELVDNGLKGVQGTVVYAEEFFQE